MQRESLPEETREAVQAAIRLMQLKGGAGAGGGNVGGNGGGDGARGLARRVAGALHQALAWGVLCTMKTARHGRALSLARHVWGMAGKKGREWHLERATRRKGPPTQKMQKGFCLWCDFWSPDVGLEPTTTRLRALRSVD